MKQHITDQCWPVFARYLCVYMLQVFCEMSYPKQTTYTAQRKGSGKPKGDRSQKEVLVRPGRAKARGNGRCRVRQVWSSDKKVLLILRFKQQWFSNLSFWSIKFFVQINVIQSIKPTALKKQSSPAAGRWNPRLQGLRPQLWQDKSIAQFLGYWYLNIP